MQKFERLAIKYLIIGFGVGLLNFLIIYISSPIMLYYGMNIDISEGIHVLSKSTIYLSNLIVGIFILIDANKLVRNKILIPILGFVLPIFGICFLLIENYLIQKTIENE